MTPFRTRSIRNVFFIFLPLVLAVGFVIAMALPVWAQQQTQRCGPLDRLQTMLLEKYHEEPTSIGLVNPTTIMQVFASPDGATWTLVSIHADGRACIMASGVGWQNIANPEDKGEGV